MKLLPAALTLFVLSNVVTMVSPRASGNPLLIQEGTRAWSLSPAPEILDPELKPESLAAFARYVEATEARIDQQQSRLDSFLYIDGLSEPQRSQILAGLKRGEIYMAPVETRDGSGRVIRAPGAMIHHWIGDVFVPGASLPQVLDLVQDYNRHQEIYQPEVVRSRLVSHTAGDFKIFYRLRKHKVITVTLDTDMDVHYQRVDEAHWVSRSASTRIAEVVDAGAPGEHEKPVGHDSGFLWRINSYWRFVEGDGGVTIECESISLTRDIPSGLGWLIGPFVTSVPKESLEHTLGSTRSALLTKAAARPAETKSHLGVTVFSSPGACDNVGDWSRSVARCLATEAPARKSVRRENPGSLLPSGGTKRGLC
jgi:hypothetical protein